MDDKRFDDIIRKKAEGFRDTGHDAHALSDFRGRLASMPDKKSGPNLNKTGYLLGAMALLTLINFGIIWYFSEGRYTALNEEVSQLKEERSQLINNNSGSSQVQFVEKTKVDTVYVYRDLLVTTGRESISTQSHTGSADQTFGNGTSATKDLDQHFALLNANQSLSEELEAFLSDHNLLLKGDNGELILLVSSAPVSPVNNYVLRENNYSATPGAPRYLAEVDTYEMPETQQQPRKKQISNQMLWALEKHNHGGIDFQFGIEGKYHQSNFDVGKGERNGGIGFMTEVIFSPEWHLETGIHFGARAYKISSDEIKELPPSFFDDYPGYDEQLGDLNGLESDAALLKVPLNVKRFAPLDHNKRWYISAGLTPQWVRKQEFDYKYSVQTPDPPDGGEFVSFVGSKQEVGAFYYTTTINLGLGTEVYLNERLRWQLGLFYQKGLGDAGYENRTLKNSYGIKSSFWFNKP